MKLPTSEHAKVVIGGRMTASADEQPLHPSATFSRKPRLRALVRRLRACWNCQQERPNGNCPVCGRFAR